jgi:translation initiation factor 1
MPSVNTLTHSLFHCLRWAIYLSPKSPLFSIPQFSPDPFALKEDGKDNTKIHIRVQQRNGRKCITTVQGLASDLDFKKIARALKKTFKCNGSVTIDEELGEILQLSGDQRTNIREYFVDQQVCFEDQIVIHGG